MGRQNVQRKTIGIVTFALVGMIIAGAVVPGARAGGSPQSAPLRLVAHYFADLNAHRYLAAARLEATCPQRLVAHLPGSTVPSITGLRGRPDLTSEARALGIVRAAHITRIQQFTKPILTRYHLIGTYVSGRFRFVYRPWPSSAGNNRWPNGYNRFMVIVRRCGGVWTIDPGWTFGPAV